MLRITDKLIASPRTTLADALVFAAKFRFPNGDAAVRDYLTEVYRVSPMVGIDPAIVVSQSVEETTDDGIPWNSRWWRERLNPAGMGVTGDPTENEASPRFPNGAAAARAHLAHLLVYALGPADAGSLWYQKLRVAIPADDPRYESYVAAFGNAIKAPTLDGLTRTWAADAGYAEKIAAVGNRVFPAIPDQTGGPTPLGTLRIDRQMTTRDLGALTSDKASITIHNNGNPNSNRFDEAAFVQSGGGSQGVLYHGAIDAGGVCQIAAFDRCGVHAGNSVGNGTSIAFEMCVGSEPWEMVKENTAHLLALIVTGDPRLAFGSFSLANFSLDRVVEHRDWGRAVGVGSGLANPACPARLIAEDGGVEKIVARAREIVAELVEPPEPEPIYPTEPIPAPDEIWAQNHLLTVLDPVDRRRRCVQGGHFRTAPSRDAPDVVKPPYKAGRTYSWDFATEVDGEIWLVSKRGSWAPDKNFEAA